MPASKEASLKAALNRESFPGLGRVKFRVRLGEDRNGESAAWVFVIVDDATPLGTKDVSPRLDARLRIREALATHWDGPVYTRFIRKSEARDESP